MNWQAVERQLVVTAAFAAVNHGLLAQAELILAAFPELIPDAESRALCQALLLFGLARPAEALNGLTHLTSVEALQLRQLILEEHPELPTPDYELSIAQSLNRL